MRLFHYTRASKALSIFEAKQIQPATAGVEAGERPAVWFSYHQHWEPTATPGIYDEAGNLVGTSFEQMAELDTPVRIEVTPFAAPYSFGAFIKLSRIRRKIAQSLALVAHQRGGDPEEWRVSFEPVGVDQWIAIEAFKDGRWVPFEEVLKQPDPEER